LFSCKYCLFFLVPVCHPYKQCVIILDALFLEVLFSCVSCSEFIQTIFKEQSFLRKKNSENKVMFLECTVSLISPYYPFWEKVVKSCNVFEMYSSGTYQYCYSHNASPCPSEKCCRSGMDEMCVDREGGTAVKRETNVNPNHSPIFFKDCTK
jgi:hypothetical protein